MFVEKAWDFFTKQSVLVYTSLPTVYKSFLPSRPGQLLLTAVMVILTFGHPLGVKIYFIYQNNTIKKQKKDLTMHYIFYDFALENIHSCSIEHMTFWLNVRHTYKIFYGFTNQLKTCVMKSQWDNSFSFSVSDKIHGHEISSNEFDQPELNYICST